MSWVIQFIGEPHAVHAALDRYSSDLSGQSLTEYNAAKPHLQALVDANIGDGKVLRIVASGHSLADNDGTLREGMLTVSLEHFYGLVV